MHELEGELEALNGALQSLREAAANNSALSGARSSSIALSEACDGFRAVTFKGNKHPGGPGTSFRDRVKSRYMGNDIAGSRDMLAGCNSAIGIALGDVNLLFLYTSLS
jgi:hypothetical protein